MNYNMNSQLDDMRNEYLKLKKQREIDNSVKFQRKQVFSRSLFEGPKYFIPF